MVRQFSGFEGVGFALIVAVSVAGSFVLGLAVIVPIAIRIGPAENTRANRSVQLLFGAALFGPAYFTLLMISSASDAVTNSSLVQYLGALILLPVPIVSLALAAIGLVLAFRSRVLAVEIGACILAAYFALEFIFIVGSLVPSLGRMFDLR